MNGYETRTVSFSLTADERFLAPAKEYVTYRGRSTKDGLMISVSNITVDLNPGETFYKVDAEGGAVLVNGTTSGWNYPAQLTDEQKLLYVEEALKVVKANRVQEQEGVQS